MNRFRTLFKCGKPAVIAMIHVSPLPGSPLYGGSMEKIIDLACEEAKIYKECNVDSIMVENMHDIPYIKHDKFGPEVVSSMTKICSEIKKIFNSKPIGVQILAGGNKEALAVAHTCDYDFIRAEGFVFAHIGDEGYIDSCAGEILRYRKQLNAENVLIFTDIKKKHSSHSITNDLSLNETAKAAEFFLSDGVIITGTATGSPANVDDVNQIKKCVDIPVLVGSGVNINNVKNYMNCDGLIIGSHFKNNDRWNKLLLKDKVMNFMEKLNSREPADKIL